MTDIVERLRMRAFASATQMNGKDAKISKEAADEIERLRMEISALLNITNVDEKHIDKLREEIGFLRGCCSGMVKDVETLRKRIAELEGK
jgi:phage host-nuclease inhibitor protein Gam